MSRLSVACTTVLLLTSCGGVASDDVRTVAWSFQEAGDEWRSGLAIGALPSNFEFRYSEGTADLARTSVVHVFESTNGGGNLAIGRVRRPGEFPLEGKQVRSVGERVFWFVDEAYGGKVYFQEGEVRVEVSNNTLDIDRIIAIAESITYDPSQDVP